MDHARIPIEERLDVPPCQYCGGGFVNLLRLKLSLDTRIFHSGPTYPLSSPLRPCNLCPTLESFPHLLAVVRRR